MQDLDTAIDAIQTAFNKDNFISALFSDRSAKDAPYNKVQVRPIKLKGKKMHQWEYHSVGKVLHKNRTHEESNAEIRELLTNSFRQAQVYTSAADIQVLVNKKLQARLITGKSTKNPRALEHNVTRNYIIAEGEPCDFLIRLGVMTAEGKVIVAKYDKFRQLNKYLEIVQDVVDALPKDRTINIVDFGCGKSYLTFALYYYLKVLRSMDVHIEGLDLKDDVIKFCNEVAVDLNYTDLNFSQGSIKDYSPPVVPVDLVVSLHACDTATDEALLKAVLWESAAVLAVPCCQHELYAQIDNDTMRPLIKHGIVRERIASLITDAARANLMEIHGYKVQMLEFIALEHTPKNIMIRAVRQPRSEQSKKALEEQYAEFRNFWHISPYLERALGGVAVEAAECDAHA
jgi:trans-aconitate methyltransferase